MKGITFKIFLYHKDLNKYEIDVDGNYLYYNVKLL